MKNPRDIIKRPIITEQTSEFMANKRYVFEVDLRSNKTEIKLAIQQIFNVKVTSVNTLRCQRNRNVTENTADIHPSGKKRSFN